MNKKIWKKKNLDEVLSEEKFGCLYFSSNFSLLSGTKYSTRPHPRICVFTRSSEIFWESLIIAHSANICWHVPQGHWLCYVLGVPQVKETDPPSGAERTAHRHWVCSLHVWNMEQDGGKQRKTRLGGAVRKWCFSGDSKTAWNLLWWSGCRESCPGGEESMLEGLHPRQAAAFESLQEDRKGQMRKATGGMGSECIGLQCMAE